MKKIDPEKLWHKLFEAFQKGDKVKFLTSGEIHSADGRKLGEIERGKIAIIEQVTSWGFFIYFEDPRTPEERGIFKLYRKDVIEFVDKHKVKIQRN